MDNASVKRILRKGFFSGLELGLHLVSDAECIRTFDFKKDSKKSFIPEGGGVLGVSVFGLVL
jgi:hypothetical protein